MLTTVQDYIDAKLTHSVHTSERKSFRGCRRRWHWIFRDMYYPQITARPLEFGIAYHKAMEVYYEPATWDLPREPIMNSAIMTFKTVVQGQYNKYAYDFGQPDQDVIDDYNDRVELGIGMLRYHLGHLAPELDKNIRPRKVEVSFEVPIVNPDTDEQLYCTCNVCRDRYVKYCHENDAIAQFEEDWGGLPVTYGGRIDCVMEDELGRIWVFDWKTAAQIADRLDFLLVEDQITSYLWALWRLGLDVAGFIYHEQRKAFPQEPEPNKVIRLGRRFSVNKQQATTPELYERTVKENDPDAYSEGLYDEFIQWLKDEGMVYSARYNIPRSEEELQNYSRTLYEEVCDMVDPNLRMYPSSGRFTCGQCAFQTPCVGMNRNEDYQYTLDSMYDKRSYHYWESAPPTTEQEGRVLGIGN